MNLKANLHLVHRLSKHGQFHFAATASHDVLTPVAERSKAWVCSRSHAGIAGSNPTEGMDVCVVCVLQ